MNECFRYTKHYYHNIVSALWALVGVIHLILIINISSMNISLFVVLPFLTMTIAFFLSSFYFRVDKRVYINIDTKGIYIDKGMMRQKKAVYFEDISVIKDIGMYLRIGLKSDSEERINLDTLTVKDIQKLFEIIEGKSGIIL